MTLDFERTAGFNHLLGSSTHAVNPYRSQFQGDFAAQFKPKRDGLSFEDLDRLVAQKLEDARVEFDREKQDACATAWDEGRQTGRTEGERAGTDAARRTIDNVINGRLNHDARRLRDRQDAPKSTIAAERRVMRLVANDLEDAIDDLKPGDDS